ncbi:MAG: DUF11 domain-containing protein [Acidimicrobiales bacterium]
MTYTITVTNRGPSVARQVELIDDLPPSVIATDPTATPGSCTIDGGRVTCTAEQLAVDEVLTASIQASIDPEATGELVNRATVTSAASAPTDSPTVRTPLEPSVGLALDQHGLTVLGGARRRGPVQPGGDQPRPVHRP